LKIKTIYKKCFIYLFLIFSLQYCNLKKGDLKQSNIKNDSIVLWIKHAKDTSYSISKRNYFLKQSYHTIKFSKKDTLSTRRLASIAYQYLKLKDTLRFKKINKEAFQFAQQLKDSFALADIHWNNANFYKKKEIYEKSYYHYNKAFIYFENINKQYFAAKMLYGMSFIKGRLRDYSGSEILIIKAISKFEALNKYKSLYSSYNHLALLQKDIKEYDLSLFYNKKAIKYLDRIKPNSELLEISFNNIGIVYQEKGEYTNAIKYFDKVLKNTNLKAKNIGRYARIIDNLAFCKLLNKDTINIKHFFYESLKIRDSIKNKGGKIIAKIHLATYYLKIKDSVKSLQYAKEANLLAKKINNNRDYLSSLKLLSKIDAKNANRYLEKYIIYNDSLHNAERKIHNKFTRIEYETEQYIEKAAFLSQQKMFILISSIGILITLSLFYIVKVQKSKNKNLQLETEQQKANEQIYILTLNQQEKLENEKRIEQNRISEELHDGILGNLFGTRVGLGFLKLNGSTTTLNKYQSFLNDLQDIEKEIRDVSHRLNDNIGNIEIGFSSIIYQLLNKRSKMGNFNSELLISDEIVWDDINKIIKVNLYRILQEALQNIIKYAKAKQVTLHFTIENGNLILIITDDGIGFNTSKRNKGIGIKNIKSRAVKLNASLQINSSINKGTTINIEIPLNN